MATIDGYRRMLNHVDLFTSELTQLTKALVQVKETFDEKQQKDLLSLDLDPKINEIQKSLVASYQKAKEIRDVLEKQLASLSK